MGEVHDILRRVMGLDLALLIPSEMAVSLYRRLGWETVAASVVCQGPDGPLVFTDAFPNQPPMVWRGGARPFPEGPIDLCGLPW
jgi:hypothetical protein